MKRFPDSIRATLGAAGLLAALGGGFATGPAHAAGIIEIDGSSTVYPITDGYLGRLAADSQGRDDPVRPKRRQIHGATGCL